MCTICVMISMTSIFKTKTFFFSLQIYLAIRIWAHDIVTRIAALIFGALYGLLTGVCCIVSRVVFPYLLWGMKYPVHFYVNRFIWNKDCVQKRIRRENVLGADVESRCAEFASTIEKEREVFFISLQIMCIFTSIYVSN